MKIADYLLILGAGLACWNLLGAYQQYALQKAESNRILIEANCKIEVIKGNPSPINSIESYELCVGRFSK